jgi:hypothetical protein
MFLLRLSLLALLCLAGSWAWQRSTVASEHRPGLFFREDWRETPASTPITQEHVANADLRLALYGPGKDGVKKSHHDKPADDPYYVWSGTCPGTWAVTLQHRKSFVNLTGLAKIRWRTMQGGFHRLHVVLKLADGSWMVSEQSEGASRDWRLSEWNLPDLTWRKLDIKGIVEGPPMANPDLARVDEIGFTDLMPGGQSVACSRLDWIEVYGDAVPRSAK